MGQYVDYYCKNESKELKKIIDPILHKKFSWIPQSEYDDFYSIGISVVWSCEKKFNDSLGKSFENFLIPCIHNKVKQHVTYINRDKRMMKDEDDNPVHSISIETPIGDDGRVVSDFLMANYNLEKELEDTNESFQSEKLKEYLSTLSETPREIVKMIMKGDSFDRIKEKLELSDKEFNESWKIITSYDRKRILYEDVKMEEKEMDATNIINDVTESYKNTSYSVESISKQLQKKRIRDDHLLQRHSGQWKPFAKSELISDILRGKSLTQIIISEERKNGLIMQWLIDGKQRCGTLDEFLHDGFAISKSVKNFNIRYQTTKVDENGNEVLNEDGFTVMEWKEFDIRGKKFSQLPEELQDVFKDRQIPVLYNMNCTKKDIADDIARFNRSRPMNKAQNGWLGLDEDFAEFVDNISKMKFFQPDFKGSTYTNNNHTSGLIRRIIVESIVASDFVENFNSDFNKMCEFLSDEASDSNFTEFYSHVERLTNVCNEEVAKMFDSKDSFLWFGAFARFTKLGLDDKKFAEFLIEFPKSLKTKEVNGATFESLCYTEDGKTRSTKDKYIVAPKMEIIESLMYEYFANDLEECVEESQYEVENILEFLRENVSEDIIEDDVECYKDDLEARTLVINNDTKLLDSSNIPSLLAMIAYAYKTDTDLDEWFIEYFKLHNTYLENQKLNFIQMKKDYEEYLEQLEVA